MERPQHQLMTVNVKSKQSKLTGIIVVIVVHVAIIAALIIGLSNNALRSAIIDISASVVEKKVEVKALPPPPPAMMRPPAAVVAPPQIVIERVIPPPPPAVVKAAAPPPPPPTELKAIERTHSLPPYPALSQRMGEQGTTLLRVTIGVDGKVTTVSIVTSSGSQRLDDAAASYVKSNWRWQPPTQLGKPVEATTQVSVKWDLKNAS